MKIYIMRHAEAGYSATSDASRALTGYGEKQSQFAAKWFYEQKTSFDLALVSPYLRAQQTYSFVAKTVNVAQMQTDNELTPGGDSLQIVDKLCELAASKNVQSVLIVSHLPLVGYLVSELCPRVSPPMFSTADVACLSLSEDGDGIFEWLHHQS